MSGPFDRFLSPYDLMPQSPNVENRTDDPWPWHKLGARNNDRQTLTSEEVARRILGTLDGQEIPPVTALSRDAGARDIGPVSKEELLKFIIEVENMNPPPEMTPGFQGTTFDPVTGKTYPLPRPDPRKGGK